MTRLPAFEELSYLLGGPDIVTDPIPAYSDDACAFLDQLAKNLRRSHAANAFPDVMTFAFYCRRANIQRLKSQMADDTRRLGRGLAFHIAPSNVPINFAFSLVFGLLAGNANLVRVSDPSAPQIKIICDTLRETFGDARFDRIKEMTSIATYPRDSDATGQLSEVCDARIIWGGDETIRHIRAKPTKPKCVDIAFADRYSICVMDAKAVEDAEDEVLRRLANDFYNDTYLMDQSACSSPHLVVWSGEDAQAAKNRFWHAVGDIVASNYQLAAGQAVEKYTSALRAAIDIEESAQITQHGLDVVRVDLCSLPDELEHVRGRFGLFFEFATDDVSEIAPAVTEKFQTLTYFGMDKDELADMVVTGRLPGIDRVVPVGQALAIDVQWDGYDVVSHISRVVTAA